MPRTAALALPGGIAGVSCRPFPLQKTHDPPPFTSDSLHPQPAWQRAAVVFSVAGGRRRRRTVVVKAVVVTWWPGIALRRGVSTEL